MTALYNEIEPHACVALQALIDDGVIAPGRVEPRSIKELKADDIRNATQVHWFAGGGLWSVAARLAGWPDDEPLWTASCPCQPFSQAGQGRGIADDRHLWPDLDRRIREANDAGFGPRIIVGEQVAGKAGYDWFNGVRSDLADQGYGAWVVDIPSCAVDAPNIRQRLYWIAIAAGDVENAKRTGQGRRQLCGCGCGNSQTCQRSSSEFGRPTGNRSGEIFTLDNTPCQRREKAVGKPANDTQAHGQGSDDWAECSLGSGSFETDGRGNNVGDTDGTRQFQRSERREGLQPDRSRRGLYADGGNGEINGTYWSDHEWIICHDGKARRAKSGVRNVVDGISHGLADQRDAGDDQVESQIQAVTGPALLVPSFKGRTDLWKITGNAINPVLAAEVLGAVMDVLNIRRAA